MIKCMHEVSAPLHKHNVTHELDVVYLAVHGISACKQ